MDILCDILFKISHFKHGDKLNVFECCLIICLCSIIVAFNFFKISKNALKDEDEWEWVGEITQILIYPIDGGPALPVNQAMCTRCGLRAKQFQDRSIIPYSGDQNSALLALTAENQRDLFDNLSKCMTTFEDLRNSAEAPDEIEIDYLGDPITVLPFNSSFGLVNSMKNMLFNIKLAYFDVTERRRFMQGIRDSVKEYLLRGFTSNYSTFTLVDEESFNEFQRHVQPDLQIYFKPQFVINAKIPFNVSDVRIGGERSKIKFKNIAPCNLVMPKEENWFNVSMFGFNMELKKETVQKLEEARRGGMVHVGDRIFVKRIPRIFS